MIALLLQRLALPLAFSLAFVSTAALAKDDDDPFADTLDEDSEEDGDSIADEASDDEASDGELFDPDAATDNGGDTAAEDDEPLFSEDDAEEKQPQLSIQAGLGGGIGMRGFRRPVNNSSSQVLPDQVFPVADLGLHAVLWPQETLSFGFDLRLQTSVLGFKIKDSQPLAKDPDVDARSDRLELLVTPSYRLSDSGLRLAVGVGGTLRSLWHRRHELNVPRYTLVGAMARPQVLLPMGDLYLRLGPEFQFFFLMDEDLTEQGVEGTAFGVGVELSVGFHLTSTFALEATYRESYTRGPGSPVDLEESERHLTARLLGTL